MYDSLGRLISAANPETGGTAGTIGYQYDNNGNLKEKDTYNGNATKYLYDALNRVVSKTFYGPLAGATPPNVTYCCSGAPTGSYMRGDPLW
jgi:YD repeat-containing protein